MIRAIPGSPKNERISTIPPVPRGLVSRLANDPSPISTIGTTMGANDKNAEGRVLNSEAISSKLAPSGGSI